MNSNLLRAGQWCAMTFQADLHVRSKYSRATSRDLDLEHLAGWAAGGIAVVGTGDCVHPIWLSEIKDKLVPAGGGLFRLRPEIENEFRQTLPPACRLPVRLMLSTEISTIHKKGEKTTWPSRGSAHSNVDIICSELLCDLQTSRRQREF